MNLDQITTECFILSLFIRDDGERFLLGSGAYMFKESMQHFDANTYANDVVEVQGNDGVFLAGQVRRASAQKFDGYIGDATVSKADIEDYRRDFLAFFRKNHYYTVVYVFPNGEAIQRRKGFIVDAPEVKELYQVFPEYHIALNFEDINYYSYAEDAEGQEIYTKSANIPISSGATSGGLIWDSVGATVSDWYKWITPVEVEGSSITITNSEDIAAPLSDVKLKGNTTQSGTPTPSSPQPINVINGTQTVTVSNGGESKTYTIDLGSIELCKINTAQDYIYKSGGSWYVHKDNWSYTFTGEETASLQNNTRLYVNAAQNNIAAPITAGGSSVLNGIYCTNLTEATPVQTWVGSVQGIAYDNATVEANRAFLFYIQGKTDVAGYLAEITGYKVVYKLATPTDTQITDANLILQLDELLKATLKPGTNTVASSATGTNLPAVLDVTYFSEIDGDEAPGFIWEEGSGGGATIVMVDSIDNVYPIWKIEGPATNPQLAVLTTGTTLSYSGSVSSSQTLEIDMFAKTAKLNGVSVVGNISGDWDYFAPGNNRVIYTTQNADASPSTIYWQEIVG